MDCRVGAAILDAAFRAALHVAVCLFEVRVGEVRWVFHEDRVDLLQCLSGGYMVRALATAFFRVRKWMTGRERENLEEEREKERACDLLSGQQK